MGRLSRKWIGMAVAGATPVMASAQTPIDLVNTAESIAQTRLAGTPALDIIHLKAIGPGTPLRFGNVLPNSERIDLNGQVLVSGADYMMDYPTGVVYLKRLQKAGDTLTIAYRYREGAPVSGGSAFTGPNTMKFSITPGSLNMMMGLGLTERDAYGNVSQSNVFGWQNNFKLGASGSVKGLYVFQEREANDTTSAFGGPANPAMPIAASGKSQMILQNLQSSIGKGKISIDYQDIGKNFTNFGAAKDSGYDDAAVARLTAEKGLTRMGFAATDFGGISTSFRDVSDGTGKISWRTFGFNQGPFKFDFKSQKVDPTFTRFADISEADKAQLGLEVGMSRQNLASEFASSMGKITFSNKMISEDTTGNKLSRTEYGIDTGKIKFNLGQQDVSTGFTRFSSLMADEQIQYGKEAGLSRQWMNLQTTLFGSSVPISFSQSEVSSAGGSYRSLDLSASNKSWSLDHISRKVDAGFGRIDSLSDAEINDSVAKIGKMYGVTDANAAAERGWLILSNGISRDYTRIGAQPFKDWNFSVDHLALKGQSDTGSVENVSLNGKGFVASFRHENLGDKFTEVTSMLDLERAKLGTIAGLNRTDLGLSWTSGVKALNFSQMKASTDYGKVARTTGSYKDNKIDVQVTTREVSSGFTNSAMLVDPEKDLLQAMTGFKQTEGRISWQLNAKLNIQGNFSEMTNPDTLEERRVRNMVLNWAPNSGTQLNYTHFEQKNADPLSMLLVNNLDQITVTKNFGRFGTLSYMNQNVEFNGTQTTQPDWHKQFLSFETKVNDKTTYRTEQTRTSFENGDKENINTNIVSTQLSKRVGVSVSNVDIDRGGDDRDEHKKNYGFWYDLGNGLRFGYGYARDLNGLAAGSTSSSVVFGKDATATTPDQAGGVQPGTVGGMNVGGGYGVNTWDDQLGRTQSFSNVNISTAKPFSIFGFIKNVDFKMGLDTSADNGNWLKENRLLSASGTLAGTKLGVEYKSQVDTVGNRGIDRSYFLETAKNDKSWLYAALKYKVRTLPTNATVMIRDFNITAKPVKNLEITNQMVTNPEVFQADAFLGSIPQASSSNKWLVNYNANPNFTFGGSYEELRNSLTATLSQTSGVTMTLNQGKGSPITFFYGLEHSSDTLQNRLVQRYHVQFSQRPGPNQTLSLFIGNVSYDRDLQLGEFRQNLTARIDYQFRF